MGFSVVTTSFTLGSLGSVIIPVRTGTTGEGSDAEIGNIAGALYVNTGAGNLHLGVRAGTVDNPLTVGIAGYIIQSQVPAPPDCWHHPFQEWVAEPSGPGEIYLDETRCIYCGETMVVNPASPRAVAMYPNAYIPQPRRPGQPNIHAVFGHLHMEKEPEWQALLEENRQLCQRIEALENNQLNPLLRVGRAARKVIGKES